MDERNNRRDRLYVEAAGQSALISNAKNAEIVLKALAHESRFLLLCMLQSKERSVRELEVLLKMRQSAVSQHLSRLRFDGVVTTRRDGPMVYYAIATPEVRRIVSLLSEIYG